MNADKADAAKNLSTRFEQNSYRPDYANCADDPPTVQQCEEFFDLKTKFVKLKDLGFGRFPGHLCKKALAFQTILL